jgi:putative glycerol-1-phosphate prenyltransferase
MLYQQLLKAKEKQSKLIALLIDPGKKDHDHLVEVVQKANECKIDFILVGGSIVGHDIDETITYLKDNSSIPVFLFPGSLLQLSFKADGVLLLSLISGRNPDLLIGNHVSAALMLKNSALEVIPTGYILIENGKTTSVSYMSNTSPIPKDKPEIVIATAIAGELLGLKLIYLEAGSGALEPVDKETIAQVKKDVDIPLIVGGGIKSLHDIENCCQAGADVIVVGNSIESQPELLNQFVQLVHSY